MEQALLVAVVLLALLACTLTVLVLIKLKGLNAGTDQGLIKDIAELKTRFALLGGRLEDIGKQMADEFERNRRESGQFQKDIREETAQSLKNMGEKLNEMKIANVEHQRQLTEKVTGSLNAIHTTNIEQNERQSRIITEAIGRLQESNEKKLDQMRATVDEKLNETLTTRLGSSFKTVSDQLESVNKSLGEMKELSTGVTNNVTSLNRVLTNVKARGTWAEVQLEGILDQTIPNMYERNFATRSNSSERVEFAIKIPSGMDNKEITYLPIDSKLPMEDYIRLCTAADAADAEALQSARKALETRILNEARTVTKYINVPLTTPFAIMYLATEGLYAEVASSRTGLPERLQNELNIMIAGPTTITALLNSLSMGFKAVAINDKANEVRSLLAAAKVQYDKFGGLLDKAKKKIDEAGNSIGEAQDRNRLIQNKLKTVDKIEYGEAADILGITAVEDSEG
jgi:DNA recombination protein RmuC